MHMEAACIYNIQYTNIPHACERLKELQLLLQEEVICPSIHPIIRRVQLPKETPSKSMQSNCIFLLVLRNLNAWEQKVKQQKIYHWSSLNPCKIIFLFSFGEFKSPHPSDQISQRLRLARAASCSWQKEMKKCSTTMNLKLGAFIGHPWETFEKSSLSGEAWIQGHLLNCYGQCHVAIYAFQSHPLMYTCVYNVRCFLT